jgi:hypothetical protein
MMERTMARQMYCGMNADISTGAAKADPKDPNADYLAVLGIEDK